MQTRRASARSSDRDGKQLEKTRKHEGDARTAGLPSPREVFAIDRAVRRPDLLEERHAPLQ
jgi:hypothetical protein